MAYAVITAAAAPTLQATGCPCVCERKRQSVRACGARFCVILPQERRFPFLRTSTPTSPASAVRNYAKTAGCRGAPGRYGEQEDVSLRSCAEARDDIPRQERWQVARLPSSATMRTCRLHCIPAQRAFADKSFARPYAIPFRRESECAPPCRVALPRHHCNAAVSAPAASRRRYRYALVERLRRRCLDNRQRAANAARRPPPAARLLPPPRHKHMKMILRHAALHHCPLSHACAR